MINQAACPRPGKGEGSVLQGARPSRRLQNALLEGWACGRSVGTLRGLRVQVPAAAPGRQEDPSGSNKTEAP